MAAKAAVARRLCTSHYFELGEDISPQETPIRGVHTDFRYSVHCVRCEERTTVRASEVCPFCFTTPESKRTDTEVSRFKRHPDSNLDPLHYATVHKCPTCDFKCVSFTYDR